MRDFDFSELFGGMDTSASRSRKQFDRGVNAGFAKARKVAAAKARQLGFETLASDIEKMQLVKKPANA